MAHLRPDMVHQGLEQQQHLQQTHSHGQQQIHKQQQDHCRRQFVLQLQAQHLILNQNISKLPSTRSCDGMDITTATKAGWTSTGSRRLATALGLNSTTTWTSLEPACTRGVTSQQPTNSWSTTHSATPTAATPAAWQQSGS